MMKKNKDIAKVLGRSPATISLLMNGKIPVSWPIALKLSEIFPGQSIEYWKTAKPAQIKSAFREVSSQTLTERIPA